MKNKLWVFVCLLMIDYARASTLSTEDPHLLFQIKPNTSPRFEGYYSDGFQNLDAQKVDALSSIIYKFNSKPSFDLGFLSLREHAVRVVALGSEKHPVHHSDSLVYQEGYDPPYGENFYGTLRIPYRWKGFFYFNSSIDMGISSLEGSTWYSLRRLYVELKYRKIILSIGRKPLRWGQSHVGALTISPNATPFDSVILTTEAVDPLKWFSFFGLMKAEFFFSRMNKDREPQNDYFTGWRLGIMPFKKFELNLSGVYQFGGKNIPGGSFGNTMIEILGGRRSFSDSPLDSSNITNRAMSSDIRVPFSISSIDASLYSEQHFEDCCGHFSAFIKRSYNFIYGISAKLGSEPSAIELAIEFGRTTSKTYYHLTWPSGLSNDGRLMGSPLGRDGQGLFIIASKPAAVSQSLMIGIQDRDKSAEVDNLSIKTFYPEYEISEKRLSFFYTLLTEPKNNFFIRISPHISFVWNKRDIRERNTVDWSLDFRFSQAF